MGRIYNSIHLRDRTLVVFLITLSFTIASGCKKENQSIHLNEANSWILDSMKVYYFWKDQLPVRPQDHARPNPFFKSLLHTADRFSFLVNPDEEKKEYSSFAWYGFEYAFLENKNQAEEFMGTVTLVVPEGPAHRSGLKRGDFFTAVNGLPLRRINLEEVAKILRLGEGVDLTLASLVSGELVAAGSMKIRYTRHSEQPVYLTKIFDLGSKNAGYLFYNQFSGKYDYQILDSLRMLRDKGISELILDLRYNPGGDVSTTAKIAGALSHATADQTFVIYQGNKNAGRRVSSFQKTIYENSFQPQSFAEVINYRLSLSRVIVLTSSATASAAELLINNLRPYVDVIQIGTTTMGKDMASFAISDLRNPKRLNIVLHPLIFKLYNAQQAGNYQEGLKPNYEVNEFSLLPLKAFGDPEDPLLNKALEILGLYAPEMKTLQSPNPMSINLKYQSSVIRNYQHPTLEINKVPVH